MVLDMPCVVVLSSSPFPPSSSHGSPPPRTCPLVPAPPQAVLAAQNFLFLLVQTTGFLYPVESLLCKPQPFVGVACAVAIYKTCPGGDSVYSILAVAICKTCPGGGSGYSILAVAIYKTCPGGGGVYLILAVAIHKTCPGSGSVRWILAVAISRPVLVVAVSGRY